MDTNFGGSPQNTRNKQNASQTSAMFLISLLILCDFFCGRIWKASVCSAVSMRFARGGFAKRSFRKIVVQFFAKRYVVVILHSDVFAFALSFRL